MSRIGNKPITVPAGVSVTIANNNVNVKGAKGELNFPYSSLINVTLNNDVITCERSNEEKHTRQLHGTTRAVIANMIKGVSEGYEKSLEIKGIGYHAAVKGNNVELTVGYSNPVLVPIIPGVKVEVDKETTGVKVSGCDKQAVGEMAALIRNVKRPEPYKGKGIAYVGEHIRRKEGKKAGK